MLFCFLHFYCIFFSFQTDIILLCPGEQLQPPIRVEYKLYQSAAATAASDKSLSDTLMPSNCLWRPLPVCCSSWTPTHSAPPLQLHSSSSLLCGVFMPAALVWTPHLSKSRSDRATGFPDVCSNEKNSIHLPLCFVFFLFLLLFCSVFCSVFNHFVYLTEICQVTFISLEGSAFSRMNAKQIWGIKQMLVFAYHLLTPSLKSVLMFVLYFCFFQSNFLSNMTIKVLKFEILSLMFFTFEWLMDYIWHVESHKMPHVCSLFTFNQIWLCANTLRVNIFCLWCLIFVI